MSLRAVLAASCLLISTASAHFQLLTPPSIGFDDDNEDKEPCGGVTPDFSKSVTDFHIDGEPISTTLTHPQSNWLYRATLDEKASGGWVELYPIFQQSGLGNLCIPSVKANSSWEGKQGVLSIISNAPDGLLYQVSPPCSLN